MPCTRPWPGGTPQKICRGLLRFSLHGFAAARSGLCLGCGRIFLYFLEHSRFEIAFAAKEDFTSANLAGVVMLRLTPPGHFVRSSLEMLKMFCKYRIRAQKNLRKEGFENGAPGRSRTCGLWRRRPTLYPTELRARSCISKPEPGGCQGETGGASE